MVSQLDKLPESVIYLIFGHLSLSPKALRNVSLVNRTCYKAAIPFLYRTLTIRVSSRQKLKDDVEKLEADSLRSQFLNHARSLKLWGRMPSLSEGKSITDEADSPSFDPAELAEEMGTSEEYDAEFGDVLAEPVTDPHELDLIRSPCLYSISVKTVAALAPNLRHLIIITPRTASSAALYRARRINRPQVPWKGFIPSLEIKEKASLASLSYFGRGRMSLKDVDEWLKYVDMSKIRHLILGDVSDPLVFRYITQNIQFTSLESLDFSLSPTVVDTLDLLVSEVDSLIEQLEPLTALWFTGYLSPSILDKVLQKHGPTISRLTLSPHESRSTRLIKTPIPAIRSDEIRRIEAYCPHLKYLNICIPNTVDLAQSEYGLSDICPKLHHLRELELNVDLELSEPLIEKVGRKTWDLIDKEKGGFPLNSLHIVGPDSIMMVNRSEVDESNDVKISISAKEFEWYDLEITRRFHGLPTAQLRHWPSTFSYSSE
ncbi:hypothetical protein B7463_g3470, partial [Scytalidium lignicola]